MFLKQRKHRLQNASIRSIIFMYFTITALAASVFIGVSLYGRGCQGRCPLPFRRKITFLSIS